MNHALIKNYAAIDFETASDDRRSVVSIGVAKRVNGEIVSKEWIVQPPHDTEFKMEQHIELHGITKDMVEDAPYFPEIWDEVMAFLGEGVTLVAHNADNTENACLNKLFEYYRQDMIHRHLHHEKVVCSMKYAKERIPKYYTHGLAYLAKQFGLTLRNHHNAKSDAETALLVYERLRNDGFVKEILQHQDECIRRFYRLEPNGQLNGMNITLTLNLEIGCGVLQKESDFRALVERFGGTFKNNYTDSVHLVIAGVGKKYKIDQGDMWEHYQNWLRAHKESASQEELDSLELLLTEKIKKAHRNGKKIVSSQMFLDMLR